MIRQLQFLCQAIKNLHRDAIWFDGKEMGHPLMTTYHQNAKGEAVNMLHWMSSQLLYQRKTYCKGQHRYIVS